MRAFERTFQKMIHVLISGALGSMGRQLAQTIEAHPDFMVVAGVDLRASQELSYPVYASFAHVQQTADVLIDFSRPEALPPVLAYARKKALPTVICTTGHTPPQKTAIQETALSVPLFYSYNTSLGVALRRALVRLCAQTLGEGFDIEILETHHNHKVDAPSGTALMLFDAMNQTRGGQLTPVYDRQSVRHPRSPQEVGLSSVRGGTMVGEHSVFFFGPDEVIEVRHQAFSRQVFATGALKSAQFLVGKLPGLYDMDDVIGS